MGTCPKCGHELTTWTRRKDKRGKKIYEGDTVKYESTNGTPPMTHRVEWDEQKCGFVLGGVGEDGDYWMREWSSARTEIIGDDKEIT